MPRTHDTTASSRGALRGSSRLDTGWTSARAAGRRRPPWRRWAGLLALVLPLAAADCGFGSFGKVSLVGVVDLHAHSGPDTSPRSMSDDELARSAAAAGLRAIVLKNHYTSTSDRAALAMERVRGVEIFGGVVLNRAVGGINPEAVRRMVEVSGDRGRIVWLPTHDARFAVTQRGTGEPFVAVLENGVPVPGLLDVFALASEHRLVLATGHASAAEVLQLIPLARDQGVEHLLFTHVMGQEATLEQMRQVAGAGVMMELDWLRIDSGMPIETYARVIREIGAEHFVMSSDLGQADHPEHVAGLRSFITGLLDVGVTPDEIDLMARKNPAELLGLSRDEDP